MRGLDSRIYNCDYYSMHSKGFKRMLSIIHPYIKNLKNLNILDLGCGAGDLAIYLSKKGNFVTGVDYSEDAIKIANNKLKNSSKKVRESVKFIRRDVNSLDFKSNTFDVVISVDVFEHLYEEELSRVMESLKRLLKPNGLLFVHTEANKLYLDFVHKYYVYPMDHLLVNLNNLLTKGKYSGLPKESRSELHKIQHVNEPTYFYLRRLFLKYGFEGKINCRTLIKPSISWKDGVYNALVMLHPLSTVPPLKYLFAYDFVCKMKNICDTNE